MTRCICVYGDGCAGEGWEDDDPRTCQVCLSLAGSEVDCPHDFGETLMTTHGYVLRDSSLLGDRDMGHVLLTPAQADGHACLYCGTPALLAGSMAPDGQLYTRLGAYVGQVFRCGPCGPS